MSLTSGLARLGHPFRMNPFRISATNTVGVLADLGALEAAIEWRRRGNDRRLLVGPNVVIRPSEAPDLMTTPEIDLCVVPSEWVKREYEGDAPGLVGRIVVWAAGVDVRRWSPDGAAAGSERRAVVLVKRLPGHTNERELDESLLRSTSDHLAAAGLRVQTLTYGGFAPKTYRGYSADTYRGALAGAELAVVFSHSESQGVALAEAWAMDVPTLVWNGGRFTYGGHTYDSSPAPYLSSATGAEFRTGSELEALLTNWETLRSKFAPREWVLQNMTDEICARAYWDLAHGNVSAE